MRMISTPLFLTMYITIITMYSSCDDLFQQELPLWHGHHHSVQVNKPKLSTKVFQVSSGLEINYMRIGFANPYSEKHTLHSVFSLFPPLLLFPPPNHFSFFHTSSMVLKWVRNWKHSMNEWAVSCIIGSVHWLMILCMQASELAAPTEREDSV